MSRRHVNRPGSIQAAANDCTHPNQSECYSKQSENLYWHLNFFLHLQQLPELRLPQPEDYTLNKRCADANLRRLNENFVVDLPKKQWCRRAVGDLLTFKEVDVIAHQYDCESFILHDLAKSISEQLGVNVLDSRTSDPANPLLAGNSDALEPGCIKTVWSESARVWIAHLFAQRSSGMPSHTENSSMRVAWFKKSLLHLADFMKSNKLAAVALPFGIGCKHAGGNWTRYEAVLDKWAGQNAENFVVYIVARN